MAAKVSDGYLPPEPFQQITDLPPVVPEAANDNIELWLIRMPANEIGQADLADKKLRINVDSSDGTLGHFFSGRGQKYNILKDPHVDLLPTYAVVPNGSGPFLVRKIARQVGFVRSLTVDSKDPIEENAHQAIKQMNVATGKETNVLSSERQSNNQTSARQTSNVSPEEKAGAGLDAVQPSKKKRRRSELSERN